MEPMDAHIVAKGRGRNAFYRILCGWGHPCTGALGELRQPYGASAFHMAVRNIDYTDARRRLEAGDHAGSWILTHKQCFRRDGDGYRLIKNGPVRIHEDGLQRRRGVGGSRRVPDALRTPNLEHYGGYGIIGERPVLPAVVYCPRCGRPNRVAVPVTSETLARVV